MLHLLPLMLHIAKRAQASRVAVPLPATVVQRLGPGPVRASSPPAQKIPPPPPSSHATMHIAPAVRALLPPPSGRIKQGEAPPPLPKPLDPTVPDLAAQFASSKYAAPPKLPSINLQQLAASIPAARGWAAATAKWFHALPAAEQTRIRAASAAFKVSQHAQALRERPPPSADPAAQGAWISKWGPYIGNALGGYPEFPWVRTGNGQEARALVTRGSNDWVHWYQTPYGGWHWDHDQGSGFDLSRAAQQAAGAVSTAANLARSAAGTAGQLLDATGHVLDTALHPFAQALDAADRLAEQQIDRVASLLPPEARPLVEGLKFAVHFVSGVMEAEVDPMRIDWAMVAHQLEAVTSTIPVLGTAVSDVIATAEVIYDAVKSGNLLVAALDAAYQYALSNVPAAAELHTFIDPVFHVLVDIAVKGMSPTKAVITEAVNQAPAEPAFGNLSPRSIAASLAAFLASKLGIAT